MHKQISNISLDINLLAEKVSAEIVNNNQVVNNTKVNGIATLANATPDKLSFFTNNKYKNDLITTSAGIVITSSKFAKIVPSTALIVDNPHHAYAIIAELFYNNESSNDSIEQKSEKIHKTAVIGEGCDIASNVEIGPYVVIGSNVQISEGVVISAHTIIGDNCKISNNTLLYPRVTLYRSIQIGSNCIIHSGAILGADGFGFAHTDERKWYKVAQFGGLIIGDNVEVGANTTIDCGAIENTIISDGVKLDNHIQIGHNVIIGENTIMAAKVAVGGSTKIGKCCGFGGASIIAGHLNLADDVNIAGASVVAKSIDEPGVYASGTGSVLPFKKWRRLSVNFKNLDKYITELKEISRINRSGTKNQV